MQCAAVPPASYPGGGAVGRATQREKEHLSNMEGLEWRISMMDAQETKKTQKMQKMPDTQKMPKMGTANTTVQNMHFARGTLTEVHPKNISKKNRVTA